MRHILKSVLTLSSLSLLLMSAYVKADDAADVGKLLRSGQINEAQQKVDGALAQRPKDAQLRFLKGLILTEQNKSAEAITVFSKLTDDYPELPEPYNNLAVLYASSGQYDKARASLEMAIRTNPTYGTAHENLGDVYAKLASQAYDKALQLDSSNNTAKLKLTLVKNLVGNTTGGTNPKVAATPAAVASAPATVAPAKAAAATSKADAEPVRAEAKPAAKPAAPVAAVDKEEEEVLKAVENWAKAWGNKDTNAYLAHYSKDFQTPKGETHKAWSEERRNRIEGKGHISVKIEAAKVEVEGSTATVKFRQIYTSDQLTANSRKTLHMVKQDGKWQIKQERAGS